MWNAVPHDNVMRAMQFQETILGLQRLWYLNDMDALALEGYKAPVSRRAGFNFRISFDVRGCGKDSARTIDHDRPSHPSLLF
jgi:hypothetical protein